MENTTAVDVADGLDELEKKALLLVAEAVDIIKIEVESTEERVCFCHQSRSIRGVQKEDSSTQTGDCRGCSKGTELVNFIYFNRLYESSDLLRLLLHILYSQGTDTDTCARCSCVLALTDFICKHKTHDVAFVEKAECAAACVRNFRDGQTTETLPQQNGDNLNGEGQHTTGTRQEDHFGEELQQTSTSRKSLRLKRNRVGIEKYRVDDSRKERQVKKPRVHECRSNEELQGVDDFVTQQAPTTQDGGEVHFTPHAVAAAAAVDTSTQISPSAGADAGGPVLDEISELFSKFAEKNNEGNLLEKPPSCYLNESKEAVVQFAKFMIWAMKDHTNMYNLLIGKLPDYNGPHDDWRGSKCSFVFDEGFVRESFKRAQRNTDPSWQVPQRCVPGVLTSEQIRFPKEYRGTSSSLSFAVEEVINISLGEENEVPCVLVGTGALKYGKLGGLFLRCDDLCDLIRRIQLFARAVLVDHERGDCALLRKKASSHVKKEPMSRGIVYNLLMRAFFPFNSAGGITCFVKRTSRHKSFFIEFREQLLFGKHTNIASETQKSHSSGTFLMNLLELIMKEEAAKKTQLTGPDLELHIQNATEMVPAFSRNGHEVYMDVKTWIKNSYETHMKTVVGRYMEMNCMSPSFKSFGTGWLTSVYNARSILWEDSPFQRRSPFKTVAAVELQSDEDLLVN